MTTGARRESAGSKAQRDRLRRDMQQQGCTLEQIAVEMGTRWGFRPRQAWRHAYGWTQGDVAARYNQLLDDSQASMTSKRISDYEAWPSGGVKPTLSTLSVLAKIFDASVDDLVDQRDREALKPTERIVLTAHDNGRSGGDKNGASNATIAAVSIPTKSNIDRNFTPQSRPKNKLAGNLPWEKLTPQAFCDLIYRLLGTIGFKDLERYQSSVSGVITARRTFPELPGRTRVENWVVTCANDSRDVDVEHVRARLDSVEGSVHFDVHLLVTTSYLTAEAKELLKTTAPEGIRIQCIERDYLEEMASLSERLVEEYFGDLMKEGHPARKQVRAQFLADLRNTWLSYSEGDTVRLREMQRVYKGFQSRQEHQVPPKYASIYLRQSHHIDYFVDGTARRTYRQHLANIGDSPIEHDIVYFRGETIVSENEDLDLIANSVDASLPPPSLRIAVDTYNLKVVRITLPRPIEPLESYEYEIAATWPYPGPLTKSRYYGMRVDRFTSVLKFAVSVPGDYLAIAPTLFESKGSLERRINEPLLVDVGGRRHMRGSVPLPEPGVNYRMTFALQESNVGEAE